MSEGEAPQVESADRDEAQRHAELGKRAYGFIEQIRDRVKKVPGFIEDNPDFFTVQPRSSGSEEDIWIHEATFRIGENNYNIAFRALPQEDDRAGETTIILERNHDFEKDIIEQGPTFAYTLLHSKYKRALDQGVFTDGEANVTTGLDQIVFDEEAFDALPQAFPEFSLRE